MLQRLLVQYHHDGEHVSMRAGARAMAEKDILILRQVGRQTHRQRDTQRQTMGSARAFETSHPATSDPLPPTRSHLLILLIPSNVIGGDFKPLPGD